MIDLSADAVHLPRISRGRPWIVQPRLLVIKPPSHFGVIPILACIQILLTTTTTNDGMETQVRAGADRDLQRLGPGREIRASGGEHQGDVPEGDAGRGARPVPAPPGVLLRRQVRRGGLDDRARIGSGTQQRIPDGLRPDRGAQTVQG